MAPARLLLSAWWWISSNRIPVTSKLWAKNWMKTARTKLVTCQRKEGSIKKWVSLTPLFILLLSRRLGRSLPRKEAKNSWKEPTCYLTKISGLKSWAGAWGKLSSLSLPLSTNRPWLFWMNRFPVWTRLILNCLKTWFGTWKTRVKRSSWALT